MAANPVGQVMEPVVLGAKTFPDIAHVALTVTDLDRSAPWYSALFGTEPDHRRCPLRVGAVVPGPRQHRLGVLRTARSIRL